MIACFRIMTIPAKPHETQSTAHHKSPSKHGENPFCQWNRMLVSDDDVFELRYFHATCVSATTVLRRKVQESNERRKGPIPESEWNRNHLWYRVSNQPQIFLPKGYGRHLPRTEQAGTWVIDERDGKRLFVPKEGVDGISCRVL
jgi:hypothetical protein